MGKRGAEVRTTAAFDRRLRLRRTRPRSFAEWSALRRWGRLHEWETTVAGFLLRQARTDAALSQRKLAERLEITQQAVSRAEQWSSNPTVNLMQRWLEACGARLELRVSR